MSVTGLFGDKDIKAVNYGISRVSALYRLGDRLKHIGIDSSYRPYLTLDDGSTSHNHIRFGTGDDFYQYFDGTNLLFAGTSERVGLVKLSNVELDIGTFHSTTQGSGIPTSNTYTAAFRAYSDDDGTATASGSVPDRAVGKFRMLLTKQNSNHGRIYGVMGQVKGYDADWDTEHVGGVYGYLELVRNTGTLSFGAHGISAGVISCVETTGDMTVAANHIVAGFAAISKLSYSGTLTMTGDNAAFLCAIYDSTNWSDSPSLDMWKYGLMIETGSATNGIIIGNSTTGLTLAATTDYGFQMYTTSASTHASNSVEPFYVKSTMTGAAGVGGRARFHMYTNVGLGGWSNALKAYSEYGSSGSTSGMGSAFCAEMYLEAGTTAGTYAPLESELTGAAGLSTGTSTSFLYCNIGGSGEATLNANAFFFEIGAGVTGDAGEMWEAESNSDSMSMTHVLKVKVAGTTMYIPMNTSKAF
jgi:hypothetical protein